VRKYVSKRTKSILEQARMEGDEQDEKHQKLSEDLKGLKGLLEELSGKEAGASRAVASRILVVYSTCKEGPGGEGSHNGLQDEDAHPGDLEQMEEAEVASGEAEVEPRQHQQRQRERHR
jgi:hypothetical protein